MSGRSCVMYVVDMPRAEVRETIINLTHGLLASVTDLTLFTIFLTLASAGKQSTYVGFDQAFTEAHDLLKAFNYRKIVRALLSLKKQGLISYKRKQLARSIHLTHEGKSYINSLLPLYKGKRKWEGRIYLITYDIPETYRRHRSLIRGYLKHHSAVMLQESVWLTPFNPQPGLSQLIATLNLMGVIIVSDLGQDGAVGNEDLPALLTRLYQLKKLNRRYQDFIQRHQHGLRTSTYSVIEYLSILKDDPQLPEELLPTDWQGEAANQLYCKLTARSSQKYIRNR